MRLILFVSLFIFLIILGFENKITLKDDADKGSEIKTELGMLPNLISLPKYPLSVKWELSENNKRGIGNIVALLNFAKDDYAYIVNNSSSFDTKQNERMASVFYKKWVPKEIQDRIKEMQLK